VKHPGVLYITCLHFCTDMKQLTKPGKINKCFKCIVNQADLHLHLYYLTWSNKHRRTGQEP